MERIEYLLSIPEGTRHLGGGSRVNTSLTRTTGNSVIDVGDSAKLSATGLSGAAPVFLDTELGTIRV